MLQIKIWESGLITSEEPHSHDGLIKRLPDAIKWASFEIFRVTQIDLPHGADQVQLTIICKKIPTQPFKKIVHDWVLLLVASSSYY